MMETIRVNMTPCEDVQTIHASQNDGEARQWGFALHNNGDVIDSSEITDQIVFKAYEGGTEEILPTNGSTPTTSPFKGDIKYPQGLLTDQEFLYRESPTGSDGLAKITDIKGNTLVWNQLVQNGNFADGTNHWSGSMGTSVANNICTLTANSTSVSLNFNQTLSLKSNHKYLIKFDIMPSLNTSIMYNLYDGTDFNITKEFNATANTWYNYAEIVQPTNDIIQFYIRPNRTGTQGSTYKLKNVNILDLTQMGLDISSPSEFASLFPLSYYAYNQGTLLSFMGNGIKTVGKNLLDANIGIPYGSGSGMRWYESQGFMLMANKTYTFSASNTNGASVAVYIIDHATRNALASSSLVTTYTPTQNIIVYLQAYRGSGIPSETEFQLEIGSQTAYVPYTSSLAELPISQYFTNGMKSAGTVYDELTETKAITRIGSVDLGTLTWTKVSGYSEYRAVFTNNPNLDIKPLGNILCAYYETLTTAETYRGNNRGISIGQLYISVGDSTFTDLNTFLSAMSGVYLYYELATPTETSFTTASLITENAEIPLSNEDGVLIGKCTERLSSESGFFDAKIKLTDEDGECYSNKIQLHVERSPQ